MSRKYWLTPLPCLFKEARDRQNHLLTANQQKKARLGDKITFEKMRLADKEAMLRKVRELF